VGEDCAVTEDTLRVDPLTALTPGPGEFMFLFARAGADSLAVEVDVP
jgi:hypothetical protein